MNDKILLSLIDAIYSAAAEPALWPAVAQRIQHVIGGHSVNLVLEDESDTRFSCVFSNGVPAAEVERYQREIRDRDELTGLMNIIPAGQAFISQQHFDLPTLQSLYCYEHFYRDLGYTHFNAGMFYQHAGRRGWVSVIRSRSDARYEEHERLLLQTLLPHLRRAFQINLQLLEAQLKSRLALDSLEHIAAATALLNRRGQVVLHNQRATRYLCRSGVAAGDISLRLPDTSANGRLHRLIGAMEQADVPPPEGMVPFTENGIHKTALCFPWRGNGEQQEWLNTAAHCIVFILSPSAEAPRPGLLQQVLAISPAEARVLQQLLTGMTVAGIAETLFISEATVRFHVRSLLRKTQTHNQTELLSQVFRSISLQVQ